MKHAKDLRRGLVAAAAGVLTVATLTAGATLAQASTHHSSKANMSCPSKLVTRARVGRFSGILHPAVRAGCQAGPFNDPAVGKPPLIYHGGKVMDTRKTGPVVITPIFWSPADHPMDSSYKHIISTYLRDVAAASGQHTNVFSTLDEYNGRNGGNIHYRIKFGSALNDSSPLPPSRCKVAKDDHENIYADSSGYDACLDDHQIIVETNSLVEALGLPVDYAHIYVMLLPKHVESCFFAGSTRTSDNACTINHHPSTAYCAYHSQAGNGTIYANMPFPIFHSDAGFTCGSDAVFPGIQAPNGNRNADTEISPTSHEIMEAITDPTGHAWFDEIGYENGDECAYVYGSASGLPGQLYNQSINGHRYLTQEEFSNIDFHYTGGGCLQAE